MASEFLRSQQSVDQVNEQERRHNTGNGVFHRVLLEPLRGLGEAPQQSKECDRNRYIEKIQHHPLVTNKRLAASVRGSLARFTNTESRP